MARTLGASRLRGFFSITLPMAWPAVFSAMALGLAASEEDVMKIFKKNKQLFDIVKEQDADFFKNLMAEFTKAKAKFQPQQENS